MNNPRIQQKIKEIIESCRTPRGGFTKRFFQSFGFVHGDHWTAPAGWFERLLRDGDIKEVTAMAKAYHSWDKLAFLPPVDTTPPPPVAPCPAEHGSVISRVLGRLAALEAKVAWIEEKMQQDESSGL